MGSKHLLDNVQMEFSGYLEGMYIFKSTNQCPYLWFIQKNAVVEIGTGPTDRHR
jgi:hypothetical protein